VGNTLVLKDPRFNIDLDKETSTYTLRISDIQETDGAEYQCQVLVALTDKVEAVVPLYVRRPPIISDNSTRSVITWEGNRVVLKCYASGYPPPEIYWRRQNNHRLPGDRGLIYKGNVLVIEKVERKDRGTYYCVASNVVGTGARRNIDVEVEHTPSISIPRKRLGQALQFDMDLECQIEAYPPPAIKWYEVGKTEQLTTNQHYRISHFVNDDQHVNTILRAVTIEKFQYQKYMCVAENRLGKSNATVELFETVIPICPPACDAVNYSSEADMITPASVYSVLILSALSLISKW